VFDFQELELLLCGMPNIDIDDWIRNTEYGGDFARGGQVRRPGRRGRGGGGGGGGGRGGPGGGGARKMCMICGA
jgi:hypothetical protein